MDPTTFLTCALDVGFTSSPHTGQLLDLALLSQVCMGRFLLPRPHCCPCLPP